MLEKFWIDFIIIIISSQLIKAQIYYKLGIIIISHEKYSFVGHASRKEKDGASFVYDFTGPGMTHDWVETVLFSLPISVAVRAEHCAHINSRWEILLSPQGSLNPFQAVCQTSLGDLLPTITCDNLQRTIQLAPPSG